MPVCSLKDTEKVFGVILSITFRVRAIVLILLDESLLLVLGQLADDLRGPYVHCPIGYEFLRLGDEGCEFDARLNEAQRLAETLGNLITGLPGLDKFIEGKRLTFASTLKYRHNDMNDLERVTKQAYGMIAYAGMSDKLPNVCFYNNAEYQFQKPYSETTAKVMDDEVLRMINEQYERAKQILTEHQEGHAQLAQLLVDREVIFAEDVENIFGKRPWTSRAEELLEAQMKADAERMAEERAHELEAQGKLEEKKSEEERSEEEKSEGNSKE